VTGTDRIEPFLVRAGEHRERAVHDDVERIADLALTDDHSAGAYLDRIHVCGQAGERDAVEAGGEVHAAKALAALLVDVPRAQFGRMLVPTYRRECAGTAGTFP